MDSTGGDATTTTGDPSTGDPPGPTSEPTTGTSGTSGTSGTTGPEPECDVSLDCDGYCEYCIDGQCQDSPGCCGLWPGPDGELELRCIGYECYDDAACSEGYECDGDGFGGFCQPLTPIPVCERQPLMLSAIGLQGTPSALALADLDGDGALDLIAVLPETAAVEIALGDGMGGFAASMTFSTGLSGEAQRVAVADFNLDNSPDLAVLRPPLGELSLLFGQDAVFAAPVPHTVGESSQQVWAGDFDDDGHADVLAHGGEVGLGTITVRLGDGQGGLGDSFGMLAGNDVKFAAGVGSVAGDGRLDIVTTALDQPGATIFNVEENVGFEAITTLLGSGWSRHEAFAVGDVDGDGVDDVVGLRAPGGVALIQPWPMSTPGAEFAVEGEVQLGPVGDVDGDGRGDLVTVGTGPPTVRVIYLDAPCIEAHALPAATTAPLLAAGDLDGDGKIDVVAGASEGASASVLRSGP